MVLLGEGSISDAIISRTGSFMTFKRLSHAALSLCAPYEAWIEDINAEESMKRCQDSPRCFAVDHVVMDDGKQYAWLCEDETQSSFLDRKEASDFTGNHYYKVRPQKKLKRRNQTRKAVEAKSNKIACLL